jgi:hypothetical protein
MADSINILWTRMNTGRLVTVQRDVNPRSSTYNTTREEYTYDDIACPAG